MPIVPAALACAAVVAAAAALEPVLHAIGPAEIVFNKSRDSCPGKVKWARGRWVSCEEPDSMPIAWHNPLTNTSSVISATSCTYATVGPTLQALQRHDCARQPYLAINDSRPWTYANHQWMQSVRVNPDGTGTALIHNEFHGEMSGNKSYCSFTTKTPTGQCIEWSTDLGATTDGGATWKLTHAPLFTLPRPYVKDLPIAGYGELGSVLRGNDGFFYAHVFRSYCNNTGAGPPGTAARGTCVVRTANLSDPSSYRGWNGTAWSTTWTDPYDSPTPPDELFRRTCADIDLGPPNAQSSHVNPKRFAGKLTDAPGWPTHVMTGWPQGPNSVSFYFPTVAGRADGPAPFTSWKRANATLELGGWMDPCTVGGNRFAFMYPNLIDHSSPFGLSDGGGGALKADGLSYALAGNTSLYLYAVLSREFVVRFPVAWFLPGDPLPRAPFPPPPPPALNPAACGRFRVTAPLAGVSGVYVKAAGPPQPDGTSVYRKDATHELYHFENMWTLGERAERVDYRAPPDAPGHAEVPQVWDTACAKDGPTVACDEGR